MLSVVSSTLALAASLSLGAASTRVPTPLTSATSPQVLTGAPVSCASFAATGLPCVEVPRCSAGADSATSSDVVHLEINKLSNGLGPSVSHSDVALCFDDQKLYVTHTALEQKHLTDAGYRTCNDPIYDADVAEMFIAPYMEVTAHCYNELDISPFGVMFDAGIYNKNLNHTGIQGFPFECDGGGKSYSAHINQEEQYWKADMAFPFSLLNCPYNCPIEDRYCGHSTPNYVYRANFYRINELQPVSFCSSTSCEYMAWSPTLSNPPAFHEPSKFGYLILKL